MTPTGNTASAAAGGWRAVPTMLFVPPVALPGGGGGGGRGAATPAAAAPRPAWPAAAPLRRAAARRASARQSRLVATATPPPPPEAVARDDSAPASSPPAGEGAAAPFTMGPGVAALAGSLPLDDDEAAAATGGADPVLRYMPAFTPDDPIVAALTSVCGATTVTAMTLEDSRWNGNEAFRADTDVGPFFIKLNRVEATSVFMSEAVGLVALEQTGTLPVPRPLHVGLLPRVGNYGPGAFMVLTYLPLVPFGANRPDVQRALAAGLAALHMDTTHEALHKGRFGFSTNNFHSLTPQDNRWEAEWPPFFARRLAAQITGLYHDKPYGRAPVAVEDEVLLKRGRRLVGLVRRGRWFEDLPAAALRPALLHGALWIGNAGAVAGAGTRPVVFDPACYFGHAEADLALCRLYGGFDQEAFWDVYHAAIPRAPGFEDRAKLYDLHERLNQLNLFGDPAVKAECEELMAQLLEDE